ncbi:MAG: ECF transporter S component, partial [Candidatus Gallimonas sp.]
AQSSATAFVGELGDLFIGFALVIPAGLIYRKMRTYRGAILAMASGTVASIVVAMIANRILLVPAYVRILYGGSWDPLIGTMTPLFPSCTRENFYTFYLWVSVLPFNALRCLIACLVTLFVYKRISVAINRLVERLTPKGEDAAVRDRKNTLIAVVVCVSVVLLLVLFSLLRYFLW